MPDCGQTETQSEFRAHGRTRHFQLTVEGRGLLLRGRALSYNAKQMAQHLVMAATTMPILGNEIEVIDRQQP